MPTRARAVTAHTALASDSCRPADPLQVGRDHQDDGTQHQTAGSQLDSSVWIPCHALPTPAANRRPVAHERFPDETWQRLTKQRSLESEALEFYMSFPTVPFLAVG